LLRTWAAVIEQAGQMADVKWKQSRVNTNYLYWAGPMTNFSGHKPGDNSTAAQRLANVRAW
jgi:hypothetical protein